MAESASATHYVVEHFEEELSDWTLSEYVHMMVTINNLYADADEVVSFKQVLILTNFPFIARLERGELEEDELGTKRNTERFRRLIQKPCFRGSVLVSEQPF